MIWRVGQVVGNKYTIEREFPKGGFGITYLAVKKDGQKVVIKTLNDTMQRQPEFAKLQEDFLNEALRLAKCPHPHIARIYEVFQEGQLWCMAMEYIDGGNLLDRLTQQGVLPEDEALLYIQQIGEALTVVHQQGLLHRDIKPNNIMLRQWTKEAVLIDFGIAREFTPNLTQTHTEFFTNGYAPIEQYSKRAKRGVYTDIYALAATLYSLLTGVVPVSALERERGAPLELPKKLNPNISAQTNQAILKGMALKPHNRPQLMDDWLKRLEIAKAPVSPQLKPALVRYLFGLFCIGLLLAIRSALVIRSNTPVVTFTPPSTPTPHAPFTPTASNTPTTVIPPVPLKTPVVTSVPPTLTPHATIPPTASNTPATTTVIPPAPTVIPPVRYSPSPSYPVNGESLMVIPPKFEEAQPFSEGLARVKINYKYGYIDKKGNLVIQPQFDWAEPFYDGLARVSVNRRYTYIDKTGNFIIQPGKYSLHGDFSEGLAPVGSSAWGYIDTRGNTVIKEKFREAYPFYEALAAVNTNGKWGYIDKAGTFVIQPEFDSAQPFSEGLARVEINKKHGYIDKTGNFVIQPEFNYASAFSEGLAAVVINGKVGYIDKTGNTIIRPEFKFRAGFTLSSEKYKGKRYEGSFSEGLAPVGINAKLGYMDKTGNIIIKPEFDPQIFFDISSASTAQFSEGLALVSINGKYGYIRNPFYQNYNPFSIPKP